MFSAPPPSDTKHVSKSLILLNHEYFAPRKLPAIRYSILHIIQGSYGNCVCLTTSLHDHNTSEVPLYTLLDSIQGLGLLCTYEITSFLSECGLESRLYYSTNNTIHSTYITYTKHTHKKVELRHTISVKALRLSHSETKSSCFSIMKFFNTQTIAVTVFLLMYCAASKSLRLYLYYSLESPPLPQVFSPEG